MLSSIFEQVTKSVTRTVLYAGVVPLLATLLINGVVGAALLGGDSLAIVAGTIDQTATAMVGMATAAAILLTVGGIAIAAAGPTFRAMLERGGPLAGILSAATAGIAKDARLRLR